MKLSDIAKHAGVSKATASRVINNSRSVSQDNIKKVRNAMKSLGFSKPRTYGVKVKSVAVLIMGRDLFMEYSPARWDMLVGIEQVLAHKGISMLVSQPSRTGFLPNSIRSVDGIILLGHNPCPDILEQVSEIPSVWVNSQGSNDKDNALVRNQIIGQMAAKYLMEKGHKHLSYFNIFTNHPALKADGEFFIFTAQRNDCTVHELKGTEEFAVDDSTESWRELDQIVEREIHKLKHMAPRPTGLFVPIGQVTVMVYEHLYKNGLHPGVDIDVIGCGCENEMLARMKPQPASIRIPVETIGKRAVEQLLWRISNPDEASATGVVVPPVLIEGQDIKSPK